MGKDWLRGEFYSVLSFTSYVCARFTWGKRVALVGTVIAIELSMQMELPVTIAELRRLSGRFLAIETYSEIRRMLICDAKCFFQCEAGLGECAFIE
jgi:hypothetical protein